MKRERAGLERALEVGRAARRCTRGARARGPRSRERRRVEVLGGAAMLAVAQLDRDREREVHARAAVGERRAEHPLGEPEVAALERRAERDLAFREARHRRAVDRADLLTAAQRALVQRILEHAVVGEQVGQRVVVEAVPRLADGLQCLDRCHALSRHR